MKGVLITGGAGFIGSHLADELLAQGYSVRVLDSLIEQVYGPGQGRPGYLDREVELTVGDVTDREAVDRALDGVDAVFHLADRLALAARRRIESTAGQAFNVGGGLLISVSLLELLELIGDLHGDRPGVRHAPWRPGDQRYYVSDTSRFGRATGWRPATPVAEGVARLYQWLADEVAGPVPGAFEGTGLSRPSAAVAIEGRAA